MDEDREQLTREELVAWIRKLRAGIRHLSPCLSEEGWLSRTLHAFPNSNQLRRRSIRFFCASISSRAFVIVGYATSPARRSTVPDRKTEKRLLMGDDTPPPQPLKQGYRDCGRLDDHAPDLHPCQRKRSEAGRGSVGILIVPKSGEAGQRPN